MLVKNSSSAPRATASARAGPRASVTGGAVQALRSVVLPFVFRRYLDYSVFDALRALHHQIREHAAQRSALTSKARTKLV